MWSVVCNGLNGEEVRRFEAHASEQLLQIYKRLMWELKHGADNLHVVLRDGGLLSDIVSERPFATVKKLGHS